MQQLTSLACKERSSEGTAEVWQVSMHCLLGGRTVGASSADMVSHEDSANESEKKPNDMKVNQNQ